MKRRYTMTLDETVVKAAKKLAIDEGTSLSGLVERLLREACREKKGAVE